MLIARALSTSVVQAANKLRCAPPLPRCKRHAIRRHRRRETAPPPRDELVARRTAANRPARAFYLQDASAPCERTKQAGSFATGPQGGASCARVSSGTF